MMISSYIKYCLCFIACCLTFNSFATVTARIDRSQVYTGDTFTLTIQASGQRDQQPDFKALENDFTLLGSGKSTQVSINNGRRTDTSSWNIRLRPNRKGNITIPSIQLGSEKTQPITIFVKDIPADVIAKMSEHFFIEVEAETDKGSVYVQQQIPFTVRFFYDSSIVKGQLSEPEADNVVIETLGREKQYTTTKNGRQFKVLERHYAISPEKSGTLTIQPVQFRGRIRAGGNKNRQQRGNGLFDQFFTDNDPFFASQPTQPVSSQSQAVVINVLPVSGADVAKNWIPAEELILEDSWAKRRPQFVTGQPVTRTITIKTKGLSASQLPRLEIEAPENTRSYSEIPQTKTQTDGKTLYGINQIDVTYIPQTPGKLNFPEITVDWWNTKTHKKETTTLPMLQVDVDKGAYVKTIEPIASTNTDIVIPEIEEDNPGEGIEKKPGLLLGWLIGLTALVVIGMSLLTLVKKVFLPALTKRQAKVDPGESFLRFQTACNNNQPNDAASALLEHAGILWNQPVHSLRDLGKCVDAGKAEIRQLEHNLYGKTTTDWEGEALLNALDKGLKKKVVAVKHKHKADILKPLYPG